MLQPIDHFTVVCLVAWTSNESEPGVDLALIEPHCFSYINDVVLMLISRKLHKKSCEVSIKARSTPASLSFKGQVTKHTIVKWSISDLDLFTKIFKHLLKLYSAGAQKTNEFISFKSSWHEALWVVVKGARSCYFR